MDQTRRIPTPPPPPATPMPMPGTDAWARWHLQHTFSPDDAAILEYITTWRYRWERTAEYAVACHARKWAGWQATLAWNIVETITAPLQGDGAYDDDIPF